MYSPECVNCCIRLSQVSIDLCLDYCLEPTCFECLREGVRHAHLAPDEVDIDFHRAIGLEVPFEALELAMGSQW